MLKGIEKNLSQNYYQIINSKKEQKKLPDLHVRIAHSKAP